MPGALGSGSTAQPGFDRLEFAFLAAVSAFLYLFLFELPATPFFGDADQSIFLYEAQRMVHGDVMYRDFFEFTMPGTQTFYALLFVIFGEKFWVLSVTVLVLGLVTAALILAISKKVLPSPLHFVPAVLFIFLGFRWAGFDGSHRMFSPVFILLAVLLILRSRSALNLAAAGSSLGLASFFTQQRGVVALVAVVVYLSIDGHHTNSRSRQTLKNIGVVATAFVITVAGLSAYPILNAGVENFFYSTVVYPLRYYSYGHPNHFGVYFDDFAKALSVGKPSDLLALIPLTLYCVILPVAAAWFTIVFLRAWRERNWEKWKGIALIGIVGVFMTITTTAPNLPRLFQIAGPGLIVLVWLANRYATRYMPKIAVAACSALIALGVFQAVRVQTNWDVVHLDTPAGRLAMIRSKQSERYEWLLQNTKPGDHFFEVYEPFAYFPLGLKNPTRYGQIWPSEYTRPEHVAEAVRDLRSKRPRYILWDNSYLSTTRVAGDHTRPLADLVAADYSPVGEVYDVGGKPVQIWELKTK